MIPRASTWSPSSGGNRGDEAQMPQSGYKPPPAPSREQLRDSKSPTATSRPLPSQHQNPIVNSEQGSSGNFNSGDSQSANSTAATRDSFQKDIRIYNASLAYVPAVALIDTMCQADMLISLRRVQELGKAGEISISGTQTTVLIDANRKQVEPYGFITLHWMFLGGQRARTDRFLVVRPDHFDVVIGVEAIARMNFLLMKNSVFMEPMIAYSKVTLGEKAIMAIREEEQRQEKAKLESQRLNSEKGQQQRMNQPNQLKAG